MIFRLDHGCKAYKFYNEFKIYPIPFNPAHALLRHTDIKPAQWWTVEADDKRRARLNCISHILGSVPYRDVTPPPLRLPQRRPPQGTYKRPPKSDQNFVPELEI